jgi:hypothetical protein
MKTGDPVALSRVVQRVVGRSEPLSWSFETIGPYADMMVWPEIGVLFRKRNWDTGITTSGVQSKRGLGSRVFKDDREDGKRLKVCN